MSRFLAALNKQNEGRPPFWLMRQAGRYLPEYQALRKKWPFETLCKKPELIAEVTLLPFKRFQLDAAIIFSDILLPLEPMGLSLRFLEKKGPVLSPTLNSLQDIEKLKDCEIPQFLQEGIRLAKKELTVPLLGFSAAPFTLASYAIEGGSSKTLEKTRALLTHEPATFVALLDKLTEASALYLNAQIEAGVDAIQLFDSWALFLSEAEYRKFALPATQKLIQKINLKRPILHFAKGTNHLLNAFSELEVTALSLDDTVSLKETRQKLGMKFVLQGNLKPEEFLRPKEEWLPKAKEILHAMEGDPAYIFNLGHGILPTTPLENVAALQSLIFEFDY